MLQILEKTLENAMIALIGLDMGEGVGKVAEAAVNLLRRERRQQEKQARGPLRGQATVLVGQAVDGKKGQKWTFRHTGIFIFAFGSFQHPE